MLQPKELPPDADDTSPHISHWEPRYIQPKYCSGESYGNAPDKKINLTQYYSNFTNGPCDTISQFVTSETESTASVKDFSKKSIRKGKTSCSEIQIKPKIWKCSYNCGKIFTQEKYMKNHILVMHENASLVQCKVCYRFLSTKARLKSHMVRHSGVKHLVCLVCVNERASDLSCIRHHLLEEHGIGRKHYLFHDSYYEMSLKEMSLMKLTKSERLFDKDFKKMKDPANEYRKSASDLDELRWKLMEKSKRVKDLLNLVTLTDNVELNQKNDLKKEVNILGSHTASISKIKLQKVVTAENGMKLVKLSNGQFKKVT